MNGATAAPAAVKQRTFLGHPVGLYVLFFTEMWERFSYYGMRALLVLYMVNYFKWAQKDASGVYKWYTSLVYLTPLLGGYLADRYLGNKRAVIIGAVLMAIGHFLMAFELVEVFTAALVFLILGNGMFKPNMSTQVGRLYPINDARRDGAYTIFYMGINLGAFLSPLVCGWAAAHTLGGYHTGFTIAGVGMVCGLLIYVFGMRWVVELEHGKEDKVQPAMDSPADGRERAATTFADSLRQLQQQTQAAPAESVSARILLSGPPSPLDLARAGLTEDQLRYDPATNTLTATTRLSDEQVAALLSGEGSGGAAAPSVAADEPISEETAARTPSVLPLVNWASPWLLLVIGVLLTLGTLAGGCFVLGKWLWAVLYGLDHSSFLALIGANNTLIGLGIVAVCTLAAAWILFGVKKAERDRVLAIYAMGAFVVFFWAAFEQAGNAMNLWADKTTDRYLSAAAPVPSVYPEPPPKEEEASRTSGWWKWINMWRLKPGDSKDNSGGLSGWWYGLWNPVSTEWFQSINALAIFALAPLFAWLWTVLERGRFSPATPTKMAIGILLMSSAFALMLFAARSEDQPSAVALPDGLPNKVEVENGRLVSKEEKRPYQNGRLTYDDAAHTLHATGVLPDTERDLIVRETAPDDFVAAAKDLQMKSQDAVADADGNFTASVRLEHEPDGFDLRYAGLGDGVKYDKAAQTLTVVNKRLADKDVKALLVAAGDPKFRAAIDELYQDSAKFKVSSWWLFWFYILSTLGELCLSPVGLSMVSKLAPAKFATMLMGLWLVTIFFGNFAAGQAGEEWNTITPFTYFGLLTGALAAAAAVLFGLAWLIRRMMHGVK